jgi:hypothetical protein
VAAKLIKKIFFKVKWSSIVVIFYSNSSEIAQVFWFLDHGLSTIQQPDHF